MRYVSGNTTKYLYFVAVDVTDLKTRETGLSGFTVYRSRNGAAAAAYTTPTINETDSTNMPGVYELLLDEDMTIDAGDDSQEVCLHITHASMAPVTRVFELYRREVTSGETIGVSSGAVASVTTTATATAVTTVNGLAANVITAASIATGAIDADAIAADAAAEIADAVWDEDATGHQAQGTFGQAIGDPVADANTIYGAVVTGAAGATVAADIIAIQADTDNIQTRLPAALVGGRIDADMGAISTDSGAADNLETMLDATGGGTLSLGKLNIVNSAGDAIVASSTGGNGSGINASGHGTGEGLKSTGGATGHGIQAAGGATSGSGVQVEGVTYGLRIENTNVGLGLSIYSPADSGAEIEGGWEGLTLIGGDGASGLAAYGGGTIGAGILAYGGSTGHGIEANGGGSGEGIKATGGATGHGMELVGGATSGDGLRAPVTSGVKLSSADFTGAVVDDAANSASAFLTDLTQTADDHWKESFVRITSGALLGQVRLCSAYNGTTKFITVSPAFTAEPAAAVTFELVNE
jgi:hypothetical protein